MRTATTLVLLLSACSAGLTPPPGRALCYAAADIRAQQRVDRECRIGDAGVPFSECPASESIMSQLKEEQEACR